MFRNDAPEANSIAEEPVNEKIIIFAIGSFPAIPRGLAKTTAQLMCLQLYEDLAKLIVETTNYLIPHNKQDVP